MSAHNDGGPAFPCMPPQDTAAGAATGYPYPDAGMTLRDYFAAKAMQGMYASDTPDWCIADADVHKRAASAYRMADAMLAARREVKP